MIFVFHFLFSVGGRQPFYESRVQVIDPGFPVEHKVSNNGFFLNGAALLLNSANQQIRGI